MNPLFTIITVTYNASNFIPFTLMSVKEQSFTDFEYLIIDGESKDSTLKIIESHPMPQLQVFSEPDNGLYDAMNKGIMKASGKYLIFLNAGDCFANEGTLASIAEKAKATDADIIYGQTLLINAAKKILGDRHLTAPDSLNFNSFKKGMVVCHQAFIAKKDIVTPYDLSYKFSADYDWCIKCLNVAKSTAFINETLIHYLIGGTTDKNQKKSLLERFEIMCKYYGTFSTVISHLKFMPRYLKEKRRKKKLVGTE